MEILKDLAELLDLKYEILPWSTTEAVEMNWDDVFDALRRKKDADIVAGTSIMTYNRSLIADFTYPIQFVHTGILTAAPKRSRNDAMLIITESLQWEVWMATAICIFVSALVLFFLSNTLRRVYDEEAFSLFGSVWVFFSIFVQQGIPEQPRSWSIRILISMWWLASITLMATFTGSLVAIFAVEKAYLPFNSFEELVNLVKQGKYMILMSKQSMAKSDIIKISPLPIHKELWYEVNVNNKIKYANNTKDAVDFMLNDPSYVILGSTTILRMYAQTDCRLALLQETILPTLISIALTKDSPYTTFFSNRIQNLVELGFTAKWIRDYSSYMASKNTVFCNETFSPAMKGTLDLKRAQGAFWILIGGLLVAIITLFIEITVHSMNNGAASEDGRIARYKQWLCSCIRHIR
ncbi:Ligand-gated ion channel [Necator americanus]|uniref:Ligand-gated ion channel n=1 Tax=Necator americanus TaxID=51031 RepID=W2TH59_NECAM|nr:Ligand-gated ion channel [Necator americanus]ETN81168.1 Ligand-gated ion channel [Necator americanus]